MIQDIEITPEYLQSLLDWSQPQVIRRRGGPMHRFVAEPTTDFEWLWHHRRAELVAIGVDRGEAIDGFRQVLWWRAVPNTVNLELQRAIEASAALDCDVDVSIPSGLSLRGYQKACVAFYRGKKALLNADSPGLGKTIESIATINEHPWKSILVVCPATLKITWYRELKKWLTRPMTVWMAEGNLFPKRDIVIINYDILHKFPAQLSRDWDLVLLDECHKLRNPKSRQSKCVFSLQRYARNRIGLTGTPIVNEAEDIFPILSWLDPITYDNPVRFAHYFSNHKTLSQQLRASGIMLRRLKEDVLTELPPKVRRVIEFDCPDTAFLREEQAAFSAKADRLARLEVALLCAENLHNDDDYRRVLGEIDDTWSVAFSEMSAFRKRTGVAKIPMVIEYLKGAIEESGKVIVGGHHREVLEAIHAAFPGSVLLYGGMSTADKQVSVDRFQNDPKCQLFVGSLLAAGEGITLTASSRLIFAEMDWRPSVMEQFESRPHRMGQLESVLCDYLVMKGSCDAKATKRIALKSSISENVLDSTLK